MTGAFTETPSSFDLKEYLKEKREMVEAELERILGEVPAGGRLLSAVRHSLMSGGKRLRPVLCIAAAEAVSVSFGGESMDDVLTAGCALEMIHAYSLVHDDLPAMDDDDLRRGKPTCHKAFGEATAILAGDALLTMAFETLTSKASDPGADHSKWLRIANIVSRAAGIAGMVGGQMADISSEGSRMSLESLRTMHRLKTGALIEASVRSGALLAGADRGRLDNLEEYAVNIGLAFQVADDLLNVEGNPQILGKAVGSDAERNKNTYPSLLGLSESRIFAGELVDKALAALSGFGEGAEPLRAVARYVIERKR